MRVFTQDIFDDANGFLDDVVDFGGDEIEEHGNGTFAGFGNFERALAYCADSAADKVYIDFAGISDKEKVSWVRDDERYSLSSMRRLSTFLSLASLTMISNFSCLR